VKIEGIHEDVNKEENHNVSKVEQIEDGNEANMFLKIEDEYDM